MRVVVCAFVFALAGCEVVTPVFKCARWDDCGPHGACEPVEQACSFVDASCTQSGRRFSALAPAPYANRCAEVRPAARGTALCDPETPTPCDDLRRCVGNRCVSTADIAMGKGFACGRCAIALDAAGPLFCWGALAIFPAPFEPRPMSGFGYGACPTCPPECASCNPTTERDPSICPRSCLGLGYVQTYTIGESHLCWFGGTTYCAGANTQLQLGAGSPDVTTNPATITWVRLDQAFAKIAVGVDHTCGIAADRVYCWGANDAGQLTDDIFTGPASATPLSVSGAAPLFAPENGLPVAVDFIAASRNFTCAASNRNVRCWGTVPWLPGLVNNLPSGQITDLDVGLNHACVIKGGRVVCFGKNRNGQVDPAKPAIDALATVVLDERATRVVAGNAHTCAITEKHGAVWCWGASTEGQLGSGVVGPGPVEVPMPGAVGPITAGDDVTCSIHGDDRVRCWGQVLQTNGSSYSDFEICERDIP